jgi:hypothetical protein
MASAFSALELRVPLASAVKEAVCNLASEPCVAVVYVSGDVDVYHLEVPLWLRLAVSGISVTLAVVCRGEKCL